MKVHVFSPYFFLNIEQQFEMYEPKQRIAKTGTLFFIKNQ